jgi:hypothetical protein
VEKNITLDPRTTFDKAHQAIFLFRQIMVQRSSRIKNSDNGNVPVISGGGD